MQDLTRNTKAQNIRDVIRYIQRFQNAVIVIYIDDEIIGSPLFSSHMRDISLIHQAGLKVVIVPGARRRIDQILTESHIEWEFKDNTRITSENAIPQIKMAAFDVSNIVMTSLAAHQITATIGNWVRARAKGVLEGIDYGTAGEIDKLQADAIRKMLFAMADDVRVIFVKIADRLDRIRNIKSLEPKEQRVLASEIIDIWAPLADRLGMQTEKNEFEDLSLKYTNPDAFQQIKAVIAQKKDERAS